MFWVKVLEWMCAYQHRPNILLSSGKLMKLDSIDTGQLASQLIRTHFLFQSACK